VAWHHDGAAKGPMISPEIFGPIELLRVMPLAGVASTR
jgi:hypothetical protein